LYAEETEVEESIDIDSIKASLALLQRDLELYNTEFVPRSYFMRLVVNSTFLNDDDEVQKLKDLLVYEFPDNRYTEAAREFLAGESVTFMTVMEKYQLSRFEHAMGFHTLGSEAFGDSLNYVIGVLESLLDTEIADLRDRVLYTLGFIHYFDMGDTLTARVYLEELMESSPTSDYAVFAKRFFDDNQFVQLGRLPSIVEEELAQAALEAEEEVEEEIELHDEVEEVDDELPDIEIEDYLDFDDDE